MLALGDAAHSDPAPEAPKAPMAQPLALPPIPPASREGQAASADAYGTTVETIVNEAKEVIARGEGTDCNEQGKGAHEGNEKEET